MRKRSDYTFDYIRRWRSWNLLFMRFSGCIKGSSPMSSANRKKTCLARQVFFISQFFISQNAGGTRTREGMGVGGRFGEPSGSIIYSANIGTIFWLSTSTRPRVVIFSDGITGRLRNTNSFPPWIIGDPNTSACHQGQHFCMSFSYNHLIKRFDFCRWC